MTTETLSLNDLLTGQFGVVVESVPRAADSVNSYRDREKLLLKMLPPVVVRRLDSGFGRCNTVHPETGQALFAICYASSATCVFETGTYWGYSTAYLAAGIMNKPGGRVHTFDIYAKAGRHIPKPLLPFIEMYRGKPATEMMPSVLTKVKPQIFFQDSRHDYDGVVEELKVVYPFLPKDAIVLFHDFVDEQVRKAAQDVLTDFSIYTLEVGDPQMLGVALRT